MSVQILHDTIDSMNDYSIATLRRLINQPSISSNCKQTRQCAMLLAEIMKDSGIETQIFETQGNPIVYGQIITELKDAPTLLFYGHYDVQPPEPLELWDSPPFELEVRNNRLYGRGTADNKGQLLTHILAVSAYLKVFGKLPINVKYIFEGEEEIGSYSLEKFAKENSKWLTADLVYTSDGPMEVNDAPVLILGTRGVMNFDLTLETAKIENHSGNKGGVIKNAAWEMMNILSSMKSPDGKVMVEGFYDDVVPPTLYDLELIDSLSYDPVEIASAFGVESMPLEKREFFTRLMFQPTLSINGLTSGYSGNGTKNVIPNRAIAKMEVRLAYDQNPQKISEIIQRHIHNINPNVEIIGQESFMLPSRTPTDLPAAQTVLKAVSKFFDIPPRIVPSCGGSLPDYIWTKFLRIPSIIVPYGNIDEQNHAPNENIKLELFNKGIHISAQVIHDFYIQGSCR